MKLNIYVEIDGHCKGLVYLLEDKSIFPPAVEVGEIEVKDYTKRLRLPDIEIDVDIPSAQELDEIASAHSAEIRAQRKERLMQELKELEDEVA